jgi:hypothetical protein
MALVAMAAPAWSWGNEGHEIIALIGQNYLDPAVRSKVSALLGADTDDLTAHDIRAEATWADKYRDSDRNGTKLRYNGTCEWHFVDIELHNPNLDQACFDHPAVPAATPASNGPPRDCVVDKIKQFSAELASSATNPEERIVALKFLLHFVGDLHQPLHASDGHDSGGNQKQVTAQGFRAGNLHYFWDTEFVLQLGSDPKQVAFDLIDQISDAEREAWSKGKAADWAMEAFAVAREDAYGKLPAANDRGSYRLTTSTWRRRM